MSMSHGSLLRHCVHALDTFNKDLHSVEEHMDGYLKTNKITLEEDQTFIVEVFSGCARYAAIMDVVINTFYINDGKNTLRSEKHLYTVLAYVTLFRLEELGVSHFRQFILSQDVAKMYRFLNFFLDEKNLQSWVRDQWNLLYEEQWVENSLLGPLLRQLPELKEIVKYLKAKLDNKIKTKRQPAPPTEVKEFALTLPQPLSIPMPEPIPKLLRARPAPAFKNPKESEILTEVKASNRRKAEENLMEATRTQFACANPAKSFRTKEVVEKIKQDQEQLLDFNKRYANPIPAYINKPVAIKTNMATILREGQLYQRREEQELKRLEELEAGARDCSDFLHWQTQARQQDLEQELAIIEQRRLAGKISYEEAILARTNLVKENKQRAQEMKEKTQLAMQEFMNKKFQEEIEMRQLVEETLQGHKNARAAKAKLQEQKQKLVQMVHEESRELMQRAFEQAEADMRKKMELIHEIRAMESLPVNRQKLVDLASPPGHGLLAEMSIAELKERLALLRTTEQEMEEVKRDEIYTAKEAKNQKLVETLESIFKHRNEQCRLGAMRLENKKQASATTRRTEVKNDQIAGLEERLNQRRAERLREQENIRIAASAPPKNYESQKRKLEEKRWRELQLSNERAAQLASSGLRSTQSTGRLHAVNTIAMAI